MRTWSIHSLVTSYIINTHDNTAHLFTKDRWQSPTLHENMACQFTRGQWRHWDFIFMRMQLIYSLVTSLKLHIRENIAHTIIRDQWHHWHFFFCENTAYLLKGSDITDASNSEKLSGQKIKWQERSLLACDSAEKLAHTVFQKETSFYMWAKTLLRPVLVTTPLGFDHLLSYNSQWRPVLKQNISRTRA